MPPPSSPEPALRALGIQVFERGWLSSNNVLVRGADGAALVDSGYLSHAPQTLALVEHALGGARLARLVNTHCHSDHMGGNRALQDAHGCRTTIPAGEAPLIDRWDDRELVLGFADQRAERFRYDDTLAPGDTLRLGDIDWQVLPAPGHDPHALMFFAPEEGILISGDALWEDGFGVVFPALFGDEAAFAVTRRTLDSIAGLGARTVIPGHGRVFTDVGRALERSFYRLDGYEEDVTRHARHCAKVLLVFALLDRRRMAIADLPRYCREVGLLNELNARHLHMTPEQLAGWLVAELERVRAIARQGGDIVPLVPA
jgi:glyoxylase-like metal-dependent hydrolase (beta-lactamase superfamily II)